MKEFGIHRGVLYMKIVINIHMCYRQGKTITLNINEY
jgi:hypothetical protein